MSVSFRYNICDYMDCQVQASGQKYACIQVFPSSLGKRMLKQLSFNENDDMSILFCLSSKFQPLRNGGRRVNLIRAKSERKRLLEVFLT